MSASDKDAEAPVNTIAAETSRGISGLVPVHHDASESPHIVTIALGSEDPAGKLPAAASKYFFADGRKVSRHPRYFLCMQVSVPTIDDFTQALLTVAKGPTLALINTRFPGEPAYDLSQLSGAGMNRGLVRQVGFIVAPEREAALLRSQGLNVRSRTKLETLPTSFLYDDCDIYPHTPAAFRAMSPEQRIAWLAKYIPKIETAPLLITPSSSARITREGRVINPGSGHIWFQHQGIDHELLKQTRTNLRGLMIVAGDAWSVPTEDRKRHAIHVPADLGTPWTANAMVYAGRPEVEADSDLAVLDASEFVRVENRDGTPVDLNAIREPNPTALLAMQRKLRPGVKIGISNGKLRSQVDVHDLEPDLEIEPEDAPSSHLADLHAELIERCAAGEINPKIRCQSPLRRESRSYAAFITLSRSREVVLVDMGLPGESHWVRRNPVADFASPINTAPPEKEHGEALSSPALSPFPGVMHLLVEAALATAPIPQPSLTVAGALIGMAAACSGRYRLPNGLRLNLYASLVAQTGSGKEHVRLVAMRIADSAGSTVIGKPASGQGLEDQLSAERPMMIEMDEAAHVFAQANAAKAPAHLIELSAVLLRLYSASSSFYHTRSKAANRSAIPSRRLQNPCVSLLGFATPETLGRALTGDNVTDGLLGRMLFVLGDGSAQSRWCVQPFVMPADAEEAANALARCSDFLGPDEIVIGYDDEAENRLQELHAACDACRVAPATSIHARALRARSFEKILRVAGVLAVWAAPASPVISLPMVDWAARFVERSDADLLRFVEQHMHSSQVQANAALVAKVIRRILSGDLQPERAGEAESVASGYAPHALALRRSKLASEDFDRAIRHLEDAEQIQTFDTPLPATSKSGRVARLYRTIP